MLTVAEYEESRAGAGAERPAEVAPGSATWPASRTTSGAARPGAPRERRRVTRAYAYCHEVTRRSGSSFAQAFRLLGPERRAALDAVYAFCRFVDDVADGLDAGRATPRPRWRWREELDRVCRGTATHPIGIALATPRDASRCRSATSRT
jgi:hypothetical protein